LLEKVPFTFLIISGVIFVLNLIGLLLIFENKNNNDFNEMNEQTSGLIQDNGYTSEDEHLELNNDSFKILTLKEALKMPQLYMMAILSSFYFIAPVIFSTNFKVY
jgi:hypothetical protein